jgi:ribose transport system permease protein
VNRPGTSLIARSRSLIALFALMGVFGALAPKFFTHTNLENVIEQAARNAIVAAGMTCVILTGGIDLSVGSVLALSGICAGLIMDRGWWAPMGIWVAVLAGATCGLVNGSLVTFGRLPPFIATLGMMSAARGLALLVSAGQPVSGFSPTFVSLWHGRVAGVPAPLIVMFAVYLAIWWLLERTAFGLHVYALGGNEQAAWLAGVDTRRTTLAVYGLSGALAGLSAILVTARLNTAQPTAGATAELEAIAACVIGGTSLSGGEGKIGGTLIGALIMSVLMNGLNLLDVSTYTQKVIIGLVIVLAVYVDRLMHGKAK